jgi:hypothetical protein
MKRFYIISLILDGYCWNVNNIPRFLLRLLFDIRKPLDSGIDIFESIIEQNLGFTGHFFCKTISSLLYKGKKEYLTVSV